jgi:hypothetical protein
VRDENFKAIDNLKKGFQPGRKGCRNKDGEIREDQEMLHRWEEYFKELLNMEKKRHEERILKITNNKQEQKIIIGEDEEAST